MININANNIQFPEAFFDLSKKVYSQQPFFQDNKNEFALLFSALNPYFKTGKAAYNIIEDKSRAIMFYDKSVKYQEKQVAYFGYWETVDDIEINKELFNKCETWAKDQGADLLIGPINFNTYHKYRLNLTLDDHTPFLNEPYNPVYYPQILKDCGFKELNNYVSYVAQDKEKIQKWYNIYNEKRDLLNFAEYTFKFITPELWMERLEEIHQKSEMVFGDNFAYSPIDLNTFQIKYGQMFSHLICPKTSLFAFDKENQIVGTIINFPNYLDLIKKGIGFSEFNFENYLKQQEKPTLLLKTVGMLKEHSHMGYLLINMILQIIPNALKNYENFIFCLMQDGNYPSKLGKEFSDFTKKYALYVKEL